MSKPKCHCSLERLDVFVQEPLLQVRAVVALLIFADFISMWTALVLPLSAPPLALAQRGFSTCRTRRVS